MVSGKPGERLSPPHTWHFCLKLRSLSAGSAPPQLANCFPSESIAASLTCRAELLLGLQQPQLLKVGGACVPDSHTAHTVTRPGARSLSPLANRWNFPFRSRASPRITCLSAPWVWDSSETSYSASYWYSCLVGPCQRGNWEAFAKEAGRRPGPPPVRLDTEIGVLLLQYFINNLSCFQFLSLPFLFLYPFLLCD